ncbi:hypothetical protein OIE62_00910 [Streptomyces scopuliridis]|uniref:Uncharacterized protein n=1 Tax=Streptomyces scopuliridis TaxID=452529 RepID=A0ACD4ZWR5_9ACTN|nr:hypothetical protein OG949_39400 [Streptomyces scopuliridis]WSC02733.1 hypothetical protein OG835_40925 [Streptomyces scopuliridis]WSC03734.1 hypothetical protein OIE62_00910 [Streptomyces scopuliridis]
MRHRACGEREDDGGRLIFHVFAALAEFIRELIGDGTKLLCGVLNSVLR